jgi:hypothetical protein
MAILIRKAVKLFVNRVEGENVDRPRGKRVHNLLSEQTGNACQIQRAGQVIGELLNPLIVHTLPAEESGIYDRQQCLAERVQQKCQYENNDPDQQRVVGRHCIFEDQAQTANKQRIPNNREHGQHDINDPLPQPDIGAQQTESQNGVSDNQWKKHNREEQIGAEFHYSQWKQY